MMLALMPAKYVRLLDEQKNDFPDAETMLRLYGT